jgi:SAM-dependent methyltransferase
MSRPLIIKGVVCPHSADLCDDLRLTVEGNRIAPVEVECEAARAFFLGHQVETVVPRVGGADAGWEAARLLAGAVSPLVMGLSATACDAQRIAVELGVRNVEFYQANAEKLPIEDGVIDVALANGVFNLNPDREAIFGELARAVRQGGAVYAAELILREPLPPGVKDSETNWFA